MTFRELLDACRVPGMPGAAECARQQQAIAARALWLREHRGIAAEDAWAIALFTLGTWAQQYPAQSYDLGQEAALFFADWLSARANGHTEDNLHAALKVWRAHEALASLSSQCEAGAFEIRSLAPLFRDIGARLKRAGRHLLRPPTRGYWARRCRCRACREAWQTRGQ